MDHRIMNHMDIQNLIRESEALLVVQNGFTILF